MIVESGAIELYVQDHAGGRIALATVGPGEITGEIALLDGGPRTASAVALTDSVVQCLPRERFLELLDSDREVALSFLGLIAYRLRQADALLRSRVVRNPNAEILHQVSPFARGASFVAQWSGSLAFLALNIAIFTAWIVVNVGLVPIITPFDPYPFGFLTMAVSLEAIILSILVLLSQNMEAGKDRVRNDIEYEINLKAEREIAVLHEKVDRLFDILVRRLPVSPSSPSTQRLT